MSNTPKIKLDQVYLGTFDMDNDGETISPIIVAVASEPLPMFDNFDDTPKQDRNIPIYQITDVDFLVTKKGEYTGKANVTISNESQFPDLDNLDFPDSEYGEDNDFDENTIDDTVLQEMKDAFLSKINSSYELADELGEEYNGSIDYVLTIDNSFVLTLFALSLAGETYITLFDKAHKPSRRNDTILPDDLQLMIELPTLNSPNSDNVLAAVSEVASQRGMAVIHKIAPTDQEEEDRAKQIRGDLFIMFSEIMEGNVDALNQLKALIPVIDSFEERIIINGEHDRPSDPHTNTLISILDSFISRLSLKSILPRHMSIQELMNFRNDFSEFSSIISDLETDDDFSSSVNSLSEELSFNDANISDIDKNDGEIAASFVSAPITKGSLPGNLFMLADELDFGFVYTRNWTNIDSMASFMDADGNQEGTLGENLVSAVIVTIVRAMRLSKINDIPNSMLYLASCLADVAPEENYWQLNAFSHILAKGNTDLFKKMINSLPEGLVGQPDIILSSYLGVVLTAIAKSLTEEEWNDDVISLALAQSPTIVSFLHDVKETTNEFYKNFNEEHEGHDFDEEEKIGIQRRIEFHSIQQSIVNLVQKDVNIDVISEEATSALLAIADINTGKKTNSSFNSDEWITKKTEYLTKFFQLNSLKFFNN